MRRALAKPHLRVVGIDDGAFSRRQNWAPLVAIVMSTPGEIEGVLRSRVRVDGTDSTERIVELLQSSAHLGGIRVILLDGVAVGGFNLIDLDEVYASLGLPVVAMTRRAPDFRKIRAALQTYFPRDFTRRWSLIKAHRLFPVPTGAEPILATAVGCRRQDALAVIRRTTVRGYWPEPLRIAHLVAHAIGSHLA